MKKFLKLFYKACLVVSFFYPEILKSDGKLLRLVTTVYSSFIFLPSLAHRKIAAVIIQKKIKNPKQKTPTLCQVFFTCLSVSVSLGCHNRMPQTGRLATTAVYSLPSWTPAVKRPACSGARLGREEVLMVLESRLFPHKVE